mmetsp:Transcript_74168/g.239862  ORF Transcript_74168/g.239862 Transcript_74168/m.239862 type:complete len:204 (+) Transcript_74168:474-1085(+)
MTITVRGRSVLFTPVPCSSRPSKIMAVPPGASRPMAGGSGPTGAQEPASTKSRWLPGTTRVPPFSAVMSSMMYMVFTVNGRFVSRTGAQPWSRCRPCGMPCLLAMIARKEDMRKSLPTVSFSSCSMRGPACTPAGSCSTHWRNCSPLFMSWCRNCVPGMGWPGTGAAPVQQATPAARSAAACSCTRLRSRACCSVESASEMRQ